MTVSDAAKVLDFSAVDDLAFAAERGRLDLGHLPWSWRAHGLGPFLEALQLQRSGNLPDLEAANRLDPRPFRGLAAAVARNENRWICPMSRMLGTLNATSSSLDWTSFAMDAQRAAISSGMTRDWAAQMVAAIGELRANIDEHSAAAATGFVAFRAAQGIFEFVASDLGVGVLATLRMAPDYQSLSDHMEALRLTLTEVASRFGFQEGRGYGFRPLFTGLANRNATLRFRSGNAMLRMDGTSPDLLHAQAAAKPPIRGFFVSVACSTGARI
mgnify:FL=1